MATIAPLTQRYSLLAQNELPTFQEATDRPLAALDLPFGFSGTPAMTPSVATPLLDALAQPQRVADVGPRTDAKGHARTLELIAIRLRDGQGRLSQTDSEATREDLIALGAQELSDTLEELESHRLLDTLTRRLLDSDREAVASHIKGAFPKLSPKAVGVLVDNPSLVPGLNRTSLQYLAMLPDERAAEIAGLEERLEAAVTQRELATWAAQRHEVQAREYEVQALANAGRSFELRFSSYPKPAEVLFGTSPSQHSERYWANHDAQRFEKRAARLEGEADQYAADGRGARVDARFAKFESRNLLSLIDAVRDLPEVSPLQCAYLLGRIRH